MRQENENLENREYPDTRENHEDILKQSRNDKIKALGFLCYNLYIDGVMTFPEMTGLVDDVKNAIGSLLLMRQNSIDAENLLLREKNLNDKLTEIGCICYNLYVDRRLINNSVLSLCDSISSINHEIASGISADIPDFISESFGETDGTDELPSSSQENKNTTKSRLKVIYPYGMEPIPENYKECRCGYRNISEAVFCGKCGRKLS